MSKEAAHKKAKATSLGAGEPKPTPSDSAAELREARELLDRVPDLSDDELTRLRQRINEGFYAQSSIAEKISKLVASVIASRDLPE